MVLHERTGMMMVCSDHKDILVTDTFPVDARKLWNKRDQSGKYIFREVCEKFRIVERKFIVNMMIKWIFNVLGQFRWKARGVSTWYVKTASV